MQRSEIWVGDDTTPYADQFSSPGLQQAFTYMYDTGFFELDLDSDNKLYKGSVVAFKRMHNDEMDANNDKSYKLPGITVTCGRDSSYHINLSEMRLYQTPNMLALPGVSITPDTSPAIPDADGRYDATNLILPGAFESRGLFADYQPRVSEIGERATYWSCYGTYRKVGDDFILGFDFGQSLFQHALLAVEDLFSVELVGFDVYVGDNPEWSQNEICAGGPFGGGDKKGAEIWCNQEGRYLHVVKRDITEEGRYGFCSVGAFGTKYIRKVQVPDVIEVED